MGKKEQLTTEEHWEAIKQMVEQFSNKLEKEALDRNKNIFCILGIDNYETRHSNFLAWLFNNKKKFLSGFLTAKEGLKFGADYATKLINSEYIVDREYKKDLSGRSVDIVIKFPKEKVVVVVENKIYSGEGEEQLSDYYKSIESSTEFKGYDRRYVYLTLNGENPISDIDKEHYSTMSYSTILEILEKIKPNKNVLKYDDYLVNHYIEILKDKTVKVMSRANDYFELYKKHKNVIMEMVSYVPNLDKRIDIEKEIINNNVGLTLKENKANVFISFFNNEVCDFALRNGLPKEWIEFGFSNDLSNNNQMSFYVTIDKDKDNKYINFVQDFRKFFNRADRSKKGDFVTFYSQQLVASNKTKGFIKEQEFQNKIREEVNNLFENKNSEYHKIVDFILNYKFD